MYAIAGCKNVKMRVEGTKEEVSKDHLSYVIIFIDFITIVCSVFYIWFLEHNINAGLKIDDYLTLESKEFALTLSNLPKPKDLSTELSTDQTEDKLKRGYKIELNNYIQTIVNKREDENSEKNKEKISIISIDFAMRNYSYQYLDTLNKALFFENLRKTNENKLKIREELGRKDACYKCLVDKIISGVAGCFRPIFKLAGINKLTALGMSQD